MHFKAFAGGSTYDISNIFLVSKMQLINRSAADLAIPDDSLVSTSNFPALSCFSGMYCKPSLMKISVTAILFSFLPLELELLINDTRICFIKFYQHFVYLSIITSYDSSMMHNILKLGGWYQVRREGKEGAEKRG